PAFGSQPPDWLSSPDYLSDDTDPDLGGNTSSSFGAVQPTAYPNNVSSAGASASNPDIDSRARERNARAHEAVSPTQRLVRRQNPYENVPSLFDMYLQAAPRPPALERFGMQIFENGTRDLQMIPMDMPVGPEYVIGPGDAISIDLRGRVWRRFNRTVDGD